MVSPEKAYAKQIAKKFGYYATWLPTTPLKLGDFGIIFNKFIFVRVGNIEDLGIKFDKRLDQTETSFKYQTSGAVNMSVRVVADSSIPTAPIKTKVGFSFSKSNSVVFNANAVKSNSIEDQITLSKDIMDHFHNKKWNIRHRVITELVEADTATIIIANSRSSKLELSANGDISDQIDIANAEFGFSITTTNKMCYTDIANKGLIPLFRVSGIRKKGLFRNVTEPFQPLPIMKGLKAIDLISDEDIISNPEEYYFGLDDLEELIYDEE